MHLDCTFPAQEVINVSAVSVHYGVWSAMVELVSGVPFSYQISQIEPTPYASIRFGAVVFLADVERAQQAFVAIFMPAGCQKSPFRTIRYTTVIFPSLVKLIIESHEAGIAEKPLATFWSI